MIKLYTIPQESRIKAETHSSDGKIGDFIVFHHLDGMYSHCTVEEDPSIIVHLGASTDLLLSPDGHYEIL